MLALTLHAHGWRVLRDGKAASAPAIKEGERLYFTWTLDGERRVVRVGISGLVAEENQGFAARRALEEVNRTVRSFEKNPQQLIFGAKPKSNPGSRSCLVTGERTCHEH